MSCGVAGEGPMSPRDAKPVGVWVFARSIEPEQSLGPPAKPACARTGQDGRHRCRHRRIEGSAGRGGPPTGETFAVEREAEGLSRLIARLAPLKPQVIAVEATGGYETVVAASLSAAGLPVVVVNPA
jgi:hypothetical protein